MCSYSLKLKSLNYLTPKINLLESYLGHELFPSSYSACIYGTSFTDSEASQCLYPKYNIFKFILVCEIIVFF